MASALDQSISRSSLTAAMSRVRNRWRLRRFLAGLAVVLGAALLAFLAGAWLMQSYRFEPAVVAGVRIGTWLVLGTLAVLFLVLPLLRRPSETQVALYLEERDHTLDAMVLSAVETSAVDAADAGRSRHLVARLVQRAVSRTTMWGVGAGLEGRSIAISLATIAGIAIIALLVLGAGPAFLRTGARFIAAPWTDAETARPYYIVVEPGNAEVARGGGQLIRAQLHGFDAGEAELAVQRGADSAWRRIPLVAARDSGAFEIRLFDLVERTAYYVESNGVRSSIFHLEVIALPYVRDLRLEYRYPSHTGLPGETVDDGGDIAAPRGTSVTVRATTTMPVKGGRIAIEGEPPVPMVLGADGTLAGTMTVTKSGFYRIELETTTGRTVRGSLDYVIDLLEDNGPTIAFTTPGHDSRVTSVEEVYVEVEASDDYGLGSVDLRYSVNGGEERAVPLYSKGARRTSLTAGHTFFLEELGLRPGDLVAYYGRATDNDSAGGNEAKTDIYFMTVRPFDQSYTQSQEARQRGQGEGQGASPGELSQRQREIVAATFKVDRDSARMPPDDLAANFATLLLSQSRLRAQVDTLVQRLVGRGIVSRDSTFRIIADELPRAGAEMRAAEERLGVRRAGEALGPEQRALQHLQRAEAAFREIQVQFGSSGGGGGGGGGSADDPRAEDLADLFELQRDQLRNQYETEQRASTRSADDIVDETAEKLKQLAARQQQENERLHNRLGAAGGAGAPSGGSTQRQLAEETEQAARQLERLAREQPGNRELQESARRLEEAAKAMRRAATGASDGGVGQSASALRRLEDARRLLDQNREGRGARDASDVEQRGERIAREQRAIADEMRRLGASGTGGAEGTPSGSAGRDGEAMRRVMERQDSLANAIDTLESRLGRLSRESMRDRPAAARQLRSTADGIRQRRLSDQVRYSKGLARDPSSEYASAFTEQLTRQTDSLAQRVSRAAAALRSEGREQQRAGRALEEARDLVRGLESLQERTGQAGEQSRSTGAADGGAEGGGGRANGGGSGGGSGIGSGDARQLAREYRERQRDAEALRRALRGRGLDTGELDRAIGRMRALGVESTYEDRGEVNRLQSAVTEGAKAFEFALRRALQSDEAMRPALGAEARVPERFRALVEEYYRSLGKAKNP